MKEILQNDDRTGIKPLDEAAVDDFVARLEATREKELEALEQYADAKLRAASHESRAWYEFWSLLKFYEGRKVFALLIPCFFLLAIPASADSLTTLEHTRGLTHYFEEQLPADSRLFRDGWIRYEPLPNHSMIVFNTHDFFYTALSDVGREPVRNAFDLPISVSGHYGLYFQYTIDWAKVGSATYLVDLKEGPDFSYGQYLITRHDTPVPEPGTMLLLATGLVGVWALKKGSTG